MTNKDTYDDITKEELQELYLYLNNAEDRVVALLDIIENHGYRVAHLLDTIGR
jgi:hypothetical protein